ncbi:MAG: spore coat protein CotJB [Anaerostipes sp.]|nr:spore coat protein CotJB [Anaerostipes sp.]MDD3745076.1 spore coat protein CotJB [Anaerostipes sp.]MDD4372105.1 spore coat protein CotJB [Anaerostipes sp.]
MNQYDQKKLLSYIDAVSFAMYDTLLYLDTHPSDKKALKAFEEYQSARKKAVREYSQYFEPLTLDYADNRTHFTWATSPWPWQKEGC